MSEIKLVECGFINDNMKWLLVDGGSMIRVLLCVDILGISLRYDLVCFT